MEQVEDDERTSSSIEATWWSSVSFMVTVLKALTKFSGKTSLLAYEGILRLPLQL